MYNLTYTEDTYKGQWSWNNPFFKSQNLSFRNIGFRAYHKKHDIKLSWSMAIADDATMYVFIDVNIDSYCC